MSEFIGFAIIAGALVVLFRRGLMGLCKVCGHFGQLYRGCCIDCCGELIESYRNDRKELLR